MLSSSYLLFNTNNAKSKILPGPPVAICFAEAAPYQETRPVYPFIQAPRNGEGHG